MQLLSHLGAHLGGVTVDGLAAAHDNVVRLHADTVHRGGQDLGGGVGVGPAELPGGDQNSLVSAHGQSLAEHPGGGGRTHGDHNDLATGGVLHFQGGLQGVHVVGIGDGLHGSAVQGTVGIHSDLAGGIGNLLNRNNDLHFTFTSYLISRPGCWR